MTLTAAQLKLEELRNKVGGGVRTQHLSTPFVNPESTPITVTEEDLLREEKEDTDLGESTKSVHLRFIDGQWQCEMVGDGYLQDGGEEVDPTRVILPGDMRIIGRVLTIAHRYYRRGITMATVMKERDRAREMREEERQERTKAHTLAAVLAKAPAPKPPQTTPPEEVLSIPVPVPVPLSQEDLQAAELEAVNRGVAASLLQSVRS